MTDDFLNYDLKTFTTNKEGKPIILKTTKQGHKVTANLNLDFGNFNIVNDHTVSGSVASPTRNKESTVEDYRLEQRFKDDTQITPTQGMTVEEKVKKLGNIKEETAESVSSDGTKKRSSIIKNTLARRSKANFRISQVENL